MTPVLFWVWSVGFRKGVTEGEGFGFMETLPEWEDCVCPSFCFCCELSVRHQPFQPGHASSVQVLFVCGLLPVWFVFMHSLTKLISCHCILIQSTLLYLIVKREISVHINSDRRVVLWDLFKFNISS